MGDRRIGVAIRTIYLLMHQIFLTRVTRTDIVQHRRRLEAAWTQPLVISAWTTDPPPSHFVMQTTHPCLELRPPGRLTYNQTQAFQKWISRND